MSWLDKFVVRQTFVVGRCYLLFHVCLAVLTKNRLSFVYYWSSTCCACTIVRKSLHAYVRKPSDAAVKYVVPAGAPITGCIVCAVCLSGSTVALACDNHTLALQRSLTSDRLPAVRVHQFWGNWFQVIGASQGFEAVLSIDVFNIRCSFASLVLTT